MNRRDILRQLAIVPATSIATAFTPPVIADSQSTSQSPLRYRGWELIWTGWKPSAQQDILCGQWIAHDPGGDGWHLYSAYPGALGPFMIGDVFNLAIQDWQVRMIPTSRSTPEELMAMNEITLLRLKKVIDHVGPPPFRRDVDGGYGWPKELPEAVEVK